MAENAAKSGAIGGGAGAGSGGGGDEPPRKSNMNGNNRSGRFGSEPVGKGRGNVSSSGESADEEAKLLQQQGKTGQVVKGVGGTDVDSGGGVEEGAEDRKSVV